MDIDLDLDDLDLGDRVKDFLTHKLKEIKSYNVTIEEKIKLREQHLSDLYRTENDSKKKLDCQISLKWKKCVNRKYAICYKIQNTNNRPLIHVKPFLCWTSSKPLTYQTFIYDVKSKVEECTRNNCLNIGGGLVKTNSINSEGYVVVVIDVPSYLDCLEYTISGKFSINSDGTDSLLDVPDERITCENVAHGEILNAPLLTGDVDGVLSVIVTSIRTDLVFVFPSDWYTSLENTFEIHCSMTNLNIPNSCKTYFLASFDNVLLAVHAQSSETQSKNAVFITVYSNSNQVLFSLLHHLHRQVPGAIIIPEEIFEAYEIKSSVTSADVAELLGKFEKSIAKELKMADILIRAEGKDSRELRRNLVDSERDTDSLYLKICELYNFTKN
ncbi:unnamed protein product [Phyllotreta striolata]|uniref:Uncharacterized protein n=1 Tax=Phyllotreta striolata TaxID=444603 RepID=A0A9N9TML3_PHYSR|nr:unnamed protein product [Phyllotreta striolata]